MFNLSKQYTHWSKESVRIEGASELAKFVQRVHQVLSMDVESRYRNLQLHPAMYDEYIFRYHSQYYQCVADTFGWGRYALWFTKLMAV